MSSELQINYKLVQRLWVFIDSDGPLEPICRVPVNQLRK